MAAEIAPPASRSRLRLRPAVAFDTWRGMNEPHIGFRADRGSHGTGTAIDINDTTNPYIVTRTGNTLGEEAAASGQIVMRLIVR